MPLSLEAHRGEIDQDLCILDGFLLLPRNDCHPESLADQPEQQEEFVADFADRKVVNEGNQKEQVAADHDEDVQLVPGVLLKVSPKPIQAQSQPHVCSHHHV